MKDTSKMFNGMYMTKQMYQMIFKVFLDMVN